MFNGIIETIGIIRSVCVANQCVVIVIEPKKKWKDVSIGESIAVNGVCLTVTQCESFLLHFTVVPETMRVTNLSLLTQHAHVNLERAMRVGDRISGHHVEGHVQGLAVIQSIQEEGDGWHLVLSTESDLMNTIVSKGYVCLDGMSITVIDQHHTEFSVTLIPHTRDVTIAHQYQVGDRLNLETDIFLRYIRKLYGEKNHEHLS